MYVEKRKEGKSTKYYLVHSYRQKEKVKKIRKYLGIALSKEELQKRVKETEKLIKFIIEEYNTEVFNFTLSPKQLEKLNRYDDYIKIHHLELNWKRFTEDFVYHTNAIEGSTVEPQKVKEILENNKSIDNKDEQETLNVSRAVDFIRNTKEEVSLDLILKLHTLCFQGTKHFAGKFRTVEVVVRNAQGEIVHRGIPVSQLQKALDDLVSWYIKNKSRLKPLVLAAIMHNQFEHVHPFQDGNGRVGRLLLNLILLKHNYPPINIRLENRREYYSSLHEYSKNKDIKPTLKLLIKEYKQMLKQVPTKNKKR